MRALKLRKAAHGALAKVSAEVEKLHFNVCVAHIYEFANAFGSALAEQAKSKTAPAPDFACAVREAADILVALFHPMMPHLAEECWDALGHDGLVSQAAWPAVEAGAAGRGPDHPAGPDQRQETRRCHRCAQCRRAAILRPPCWRSR